MTFSSGKSNRKSSWASSIRSDNSNHTCLIKLIIFTSTIGIFQTVLEELTQIQTGLKNAVEEELKSQKMKTELITNVSHDLKTPLTAIITYIDLLKQENLSSKQQEEYLITLEKKAHRLKDLIEDLFEISKATSNNVTFQKYDMFFDYLMEE